MGLAVGVVLLAIVAVVFIPLHVWLCGCFNRCFFMHVALDQDPALQYQRQAQSLEQQWNNATKKAETPGRRTFQGSSRSTCFNNGCCCKSRETLELEFNGEDGTVSGTKHLVGASATITIRGRWCNNEFVWLETHPSKKAVVGGFLSSTGSGNVWTLKGEFYALKRDFGKFYYKCSSPQKTEPTTITEP